MSICEFHHRESNSEIQFFDGHWHWDISMDRVDDENYCVIFTWIDLFEKEEKVVFTSTQLHPYIERLIPLTKRFGLVNSFKDGTVDDSFSVIEFDWQRKEFHIGEEDFEHDEDFLGWCVIPDRSTPSANGDLSFLLYDFVNGEMYKHCRLDVAIGRIIPIGPTFELPSEDFNCPNMCGHVVSGLSQSLDAVNRYDLCQRRMLDKIVINGLPSTIKCTWTECFKCDNGCWTTYNQLIVWSEERGKNEDKCYKLYCVDLSSGRATALSYQFQHVIKYLCQSSEDGHLYVRTDNLIGNGYRNEDGQFVPYTNEDHQLQLINYHFYRIPLKNPESLFFVSSKNLKWPLPEIAKKLAMQRKDLPLNVYKC